MKQKNNKGFTLIEILIVIIVMVVLMAISFRVVGIVNERKAKVDRLKAFQQLQAAISEFHAEYGIYPPVEEEIDNSGASVCDINPGKEIDYTMPIRNYTSGFEFKFGLISFLSNRILPNSVDFEGWDHNTPGTLSYIYKGVGRNELSDVFGDPSNESGWAANGKRLTESAEAKDLNRMLMPSERDKAFFKRVHPYLYGGADGSHIVDAFPIYPDPNKVDGEDAEPPTTYYKIANITEKYVYITQPPYTSYVLINAGPDHKVVAGDVMNRDAQCPSCKEYHNRDNIYGGSDDN